MRDHLKIHLKSWPEYERAMRKDVLHFIGQIDILHLDIQIHACYPRRLLLWICPPEAWHERFYNSVHAPHKLPLNLDMIDP